MPRRRVMCTAPVGPRMQVWSNNEAIEQYRNLLNGKEEVREPDRWARARQGRHCRLNRLRCAASRQWDRSRLAQLARCVVAAGRNQPLERLVCPGGWIPAACLPWRVDPCGYICRRDPPTIGDARAAGCDQPRPHTAPAVRSVAGRHRLLLRPLAAAACVHACMQCVRARTPARRRRGQAQACCVLGAGFPTPQTD